MKNRNQSQVGCWLMVSLAAWMGPTIAAGQPGQPPTASNPVVTIEGKVKTMQTGSGMGMTYLELEGDKSVTRVYLGPMRYLMEQDFNPKAGSEIRVKGYKIDGGVVGIRVDLPAEKRSVALRDEKGFPLWRGGMMMRGMGKR